MADIISYEELRRIQNNERDNTELQLLEDSFFKKVRDYISAKKKILEENKDNDNAFSKVSNEQTERELHNTQKILVDICSRRNKKIVLQALTNMNARIHDTEKMLPFEEKFYNEVMMMFKENIKEFMASLEEPKAEEYNPKHEIKSVKFVEPIPSFVWNNGMTYGPYNPEDTAELPFQIGEILIKERKAIENIREG